MADYSNTDIWIQDFEKGDVEEGSDIARARSAITALTRTIVRDLLSISQSSDLRSQHAEVFAVFGALLPLHDVHISDGEALGQPAWSEFWSKAQLIILTLGTKLDEAGYGLKYGE